MMRHKPHISLSMAWRIDKDAQSKWRCVSQGKHKRGIFGFGATPTEAYDEWKQVRDYEA